MLRHHCKIVSDSNNSIYYVKDSCTSLYRSGERLVVYSPPSSPLDESDDLFLSTIHEGNSGNQYKSNGTILPCGEVIFRIKMSDTICRETIQSSEYATELQYLNPTMTIENDDNNSIHDYLSAFILLDRGNENSKFRSFYATLPEDYRKSILSVCC